MKSIVTEQPTPADLKKFGLEKPDVAVTLNMGSARATLAVGGAAGDDAVYARDMSNNMIVTVEKSLADDLKKPLDDYRRHEAFDFRAFTANRVELTRGGQTVTFERVKGEGENAQDTWKRVNPNAGRRRQGEDGQLPRRPGRHPRDDVHADNGEYRARQAGAGRLREVRGRQERRARDVRPERQRRVLHAVRASPARRRPTPRSSTTRSRRSTNCRNDVRVRQALSALILAGAVACGGVRPPPTTPRAPAASAFPSPALQQEITAPARRARTEARQLGHRDPIARPRRDPLRARRLRSCCSPHRTRRSSRSRRRRNGSAGTSRSRPSCRCRDRSTAACSTAISSSTGSGDPSIDDWDGKATALFRRLGRAVEGAGRFGGHRPGDRRRQPRCPTSCSGAGWAWDDLDRSFATGVGRAAVQPEHRPPRRRAGRGGERPCPGSHRAGRQRADAAEQRADVGGAGAARARNSARRRQPGPRGARHHSARRAGRSVRNVSVVNPTLYFVSALREALIASGIEVRGAAADVDDLADPSSARPPHAGPDLPVAAAVGARGDDDEDQPEPLRGDAAASGRRPARGSRAAVRPGASRMARSSSPTARACRATTWPPRRRS